MIENKRRMCILLFAVLLSIFTVARAWRIKGENVPASARAAAHTDEKSVIQDVADSDLSLLARFIQAESGGEPYTCQVAVGAVVLNRVRHASFPEGIAGVIYQPGAFDCVSSGRVKLPAKALALRAARDAINGLDPSGGALYYYSAKKSPPDGQVAVKIIGSRVFCR